MSSASRLIMVIDDSPDRARNLKELIEFMDAPEVCMATPADWRSALGEQRLAAVFLNDDMAEATMAGLLAEVGKLDPNVPIVMVDGAPSHA